MENKTKHTRGPWVIRKGTSKDGIYSGDFCVAVVNSHPGNSSLIAAALLLLEACTDYHYAVVEMLNAVNQGEESRIIEKANKLRQIAVKAEIAITAATKQD